jgi:hypothetical protein
MTCSLDDEMALDFFPDVHDPSGALQGPHRILVTLATGVSMTSGTAVAVDEQGFPIALDPTGLDGDTLEISLVTAELQTDTDLPANTWAISFYTQFGSVKSVGYRIRGRYELDTTPVTGRDKTQLLRCGQT